MGLTYRERRERRAARREEWADKRDAKSEESFAGADRIAEGIPPGQPILVGHHSEKGHRRDLDRIDRGMRKGFEHRNMAKHHRQRAAGIRDQLDRSIYRDDTDEAERLRQRIAEREAERDRMKAINREAAKIARAHGIKKRTGHWLHAMTDEQTEKVRAVLVEVCKKVEATKREVSDIMAGLKYNGTLGYPSYALSNLGANIRRDRNRLPAAERRETDRARVREALAAERAEEAAEAAAEAAAAAD
ncbi:MAG: DUF3560 domain-containing protein [Gemmatimonadetes bacterium]|nr:DUF3560 domain-containing protein [Gemmatimonadota bacterium]MYA63139.1 DUF3560 domain-containing protein [Gemmatimonadota bacterium]MYB98833.1 DUF3560 domain-containing protein [Gemmatimonadota bacterium]MYH52819.1 DUF3560 domain-containing protein [Gemmatimonadota bacterium]MYI46813.1 DUF3560 domain-containing protein [Gemmatimonadota bacterium]